MKTVYVYNGAEGTLYGNDGFSPENWGFDIAAQESVVKSSHDLSSYLREEDQAAFEAADLHMFVTLRTVFSDVFGNEVSATHHYAAFFSGGALNVFVPLRQWPIGAEET
ncbi:MAG TPA: hypothetical protein VFP43_04675, partial [Mesorhizobium sp.]|nr:hypothetical protein [Mesorhizobium sp.]